MANNGDGLLRISKGSTSNCSLVAFQCMGLVVVGSLPKSSKGQMYILAATDYFSKCAETLPLKEVKKENVVDFIKSNIIFRYGISKCIVTDN